MSETITILAEREASGKEPTPVSCFTPLTGVIPSRRNREGGWVLGAVKRGEESGWDGRDSTLHRPDSSPRSTAGPTRAPQRFRRFGMTTEVRFHLWVAGEDPR